jgi:hypothetical protein
MNPKGAFAPLDTVLAAAVVGAALIAAILGARHFWRRPRLAASLSLRGSTRIGTLYVRVDNHGARIARDARIDVSWAGPEGGAHIESRELGDIEGFGGVLAPVRDLHRENAARGWTSIEVLVRAENAASATASLAIGERAADAAAPSVQYAKLPPCPDSPDGVHAMRTSHVRNDDVMETWEVCARCRYVRRLPLSPADEARQKRVRQERAAKLQKILEEEIARATAEQGEAPRPRRRPPAREEDETFPLEVAYWVLGLDAERATWEDVQRAHRRLALLHHPDRTRGATPEEAADHEKRMQDVNRARDRLREHLGA